MSVVRGVTSPTAARPRSSSSSASKCSSMNAEIGASSASRNQFAGRLMMTGTQGDAGSERGGLVAATCCCRGVQ